MGNTVCVLQAPNSLWCLLLTDEIHLLCCGFAACVQGTPRV
jgi:hypothetical protein